MKRFTDDTDSQPTFVQTGCLYYHLIGPIDDADEIPPAEDDLCWNLTALEVSAEQSVEERD